MARVRVDISAFKELGDDIDRGRLLILRRLALRGEKHMRDEVPVKTTNLKQGVAPADIDEQAMTAEIVVTARSGRRGPRQATLFTPKRDGGLTTRSIMLRGTSPYNYADVVAFGNKRSRLTPSTADAFLIPVASAPAKGSYIKDGSQVFIVRRSRKAQKANPFHERAAAKLNAESPAIAGAVFRELFT